MEQTARKQNTGRKRMLAVLLLAAALALLAAGVKLFTLRVGDRLYFCADLADARGAELSVADYEEAHARRPGVPIRWRVPIGDARYDSFSETLTLSSLPREELGRLGYFPYLKTVDAFGCEDRAAIAAASALWEDVEFLWTVPSSDGPIDGNSEALSVSSLSPAELEGLLGLLPRLKTVDLRASSFDAAQTDAFAAAHPELKTLFTVPLWGMEIAGDCETLRLSSDAAGSAGELVTALGRLRQLKKLDLRDCPLSPNELAQILPLCEGVETDYVIRLCGRLFSAEAEEVDLSGVAIGDTAEIETAITLMPKLKKIILSDCGLSDETLDALDQKYEKVRVVWTVYFSIYALRTDVSYFCAADVPQLNYDAPVLGDRQLYPIRYCRDLIALDLGHMWITDLSFLYNMPKLQYLILVGGRFRDITPIGSLEDLKYLEIFQTAPRDISPLLNCKKLEHLNLCYCTGFDLSPLKEMTQLKRLWYAGLGTARGAAIAAALPDTQVYCPYSDPQGSTGGGWREDEAYYEMRDVFAMYYQPGGTGIH